MNHSEVNNVATVCVWLRILPVAICSLSTTKPTTPSRPTSAVSHPCPLLPSQVLRKGLTVNFEVTGNYGPGRCRDCLCYGCRRFLAVHGKLNLALCGKSKYRFVKRMISFVFVLKMIWWMALNGYYRCLSLAPGTAAENVESGDAFC